MYTFCDWYLLLCQFKCTVFWRSTYANYTYANYICNSVLLMTSSNAHCLSADDADELMLTKN